MTKHELLALLSQLDIRPSRRLGQNFLVDPNMLAALVAQAAPQPGERILEIGPGAGALTAPLLEAGSQVTAIEVDRRLGQYLRERFGHLPAFTLLQDDACNVDYDRLMGREAFRCVANLPYRVSSVLLAKLAALPAPATEILVLLQREVGERLAAAPGTKTYGALTVRVRLQYDASVVRRIPPEVFYPPPEVGSVQLQLTRRPSVLPVADRDAAAAVARVAFGQRRKKLRNVLGHRYGQAEAARAFAELGLDPNARAEQIPVDAYLELGRSFGTGEVQ